MNYTIKVVNYSTKGCTMQFSEVSKLSFFSMAKNHDRREHICDFSSRPRLHFYISLLVKGKASFRLDSGDTVELGEGELLFVPIMSRYVSLWQGEPDIISISMQFAFEQFCGIGEVDEYPLQVLKLDNSEEIKEKLLFILNKHDSEDISERLSATAAFYELLAYTVSRLKKNSKEPTDKRIDKAIEYINLNAKHVIKVSELAALCNMSVSSFYSCFKKQTSLSPIEYKNQTIIKHAIHLLNEKNTLSVDEISDMLGFESPSYFYRVFKRITGKTPIEYRKTTLCL